MVYNPAFIRPLFVIVDFYAAGPGVYEFRTPVQVRINTVTFICDDTYTGASVQLKNGNDEEIGHCVLDWGDGTSGEPNTVWWLTTIIKDKCVIPANGIIKLVVNGAGVSGLFDVVGIPLEHHQYTK